MVLLRGMPKTLMEHNRYNCAVSHTHYRVTGVASPRTIGVLKSTVGLLPGGYHGVDKNTVGGAVGHHRATITVPWTWGLLTDPQQLRHTQCLLTQTRVFVNPTMGLLTTPWVCCVVLRGNNNGIAGQ